MTAIPEFQLPELAKDGAAGVNVFGLPSRRFGRAPAPSATSLRAASRARRSVPVLSLPQKVVCILGIAAIVLGATRSPAVTAIAVNAFLILLFTASNILKLVLIRRSHDDPCEISVRHADLIAQSDSELPVYTVLVPLYHEAAVLRQLVDAIARIDYPRDRLDVMLLMEADDTETRRAFRLINLPAHIAVVTVPDIGPRGKARACNHGLELARGEYLVIFDAEDCPDPDQLRKTVAAFRGLPDDVVCLQAKLNYFNRTQNVLTRWFTAEYSVWFDQLLPGLQSTGGPIPLGGTSNHFRTERLRRLGGWNPYNVTEDAELGMRIFMGGLKTAVIDSTTYEEATSRLGNWTRQRSRWVKGYMQTYLIQMRHPIRLWREMGPRPFMIFQLFFCSATLAPLLNPLYWLMTAAWYLTHAGVIETMFPTPILYIGTIGLFLGNAAFMLTTMSGCMARKNYDDVKWALLAPVYWMLISMAAWKALFQLCSRPYYWEKTTHGFSTFVPPGERTVRDASARGAPILQAARMTWRS